MSDSQTVVLINVFTVNPAKQEALLKLLVDISEHTMKKLPGFISATFHKSLDGTHITNYALWESKAAFEAMLRSPGAAPHLRECQAMAQSLDYSLYNVAATIRAE